MLLYKIEIFKTDFTSLYKGDEKNYFKSGRVNI